MGVPSPVSCWPTLPKTGWLNGHILSGRQSWNPCLAPETHLHKSLGRKTTTTRWRQTAVDPGKGWKGRKTPSWDFSLDIYFYNLTITQHLIGLGNWTFWTHSQSHMVEFCCIIHTPREIVLCIEFSSKLYYRPLQNRWICSYKVRPTK